MTLPSHQYVGTIFALSSGAPPAGVAVIRISGPDVRFGLEALIGDIPPARQASLRSIHSRDDRVLDHGLVVYFPGPASFTGEDCAELHVHGGRAVVAAVLEALHGVEGFRHAEPGEFTRRAFESGRVDLTEVEGLADLIDAQTEMQRRLALEHASGGATAIYTDWAVRLTHERALIEAGLDFSDEGDVPADVSADVRARLLTLRRDMSRHLDREHAGEIIREGYRVVIAGAPNAGKSTLMNVLARREVSIVSDEPGTTRDIVTVTLDLNGYVVILEDTAGLRETDGAIEREGIRRAQAAMERADLVVYLKDMSEADKDFGVWGSSAEQMLVGTKVDRAAASSEISVELAISARTGEGIDGLLARLGERVAMAASLGGETVSARARHRAHIEDCLAHVEHVVAHAGLASELVAEELRAAGDCLGRITGRVDTEDLLDVIFGRFCIGK